MDDDEVRRVVAHRTLVPGGRDYAPSELPGMEPGLEQLPIFFDGRRGPVALANVGEAWEGVELAPEGGSESVGVAVPPERRPLVDADGEEFLAGYLRYFLARDCFLAAVQWEMVRGLLGTVDEIALSELHAIGSDVLARASVRAQMRGDSGARLATADIELGIRATDQDWLDRPTWGGRL